MIITQQGNAFDVKHVVSVDDVGVVCLCVSDLTLVTQVMFHDNNTAR